MKKEKLVIIDGNALLHRAWHAIPNLSTKDGLMVNAVYGWMMIFLKMYKDLQPEYIAVTFDVRGGTFRNDLYDEYKANRKKQPDELYAQIDMIKEIVQKFQLPIYEMKGFEADDIIGSICAHPDVDNDNVLSVVLTGDMDTLQLVDENTHVYAPKRGLSETKIYDIEGVEKKFKGLRPDQVIDYKALRGDPSDNVPGVRGVGEKTATDLLLKFETLENLYEMLDNDLATVELEGVKARIIKLLLENKDEALLSKKLVTIKTDVEIDFNLQDCKFDSYDRDAVIEKFQKYEFRTLLNKLPKLEEVSNGAQKYNSPQETIFDNESGSTPPPGNDIPVNSGYVLIDTHEKLDEALKEIEKYSALAFDTETNGLDVYTADLLGVSLCGEASKAWYILAKPEFLEKIKPLLESEKIAKYAHNAKFDIAILDRYDIYVSPVTVDTMIAAYLINPGSRGYGLDATVFAYLGHEMIPIEKLIGKRGKDQLTLEDVPLELVSQYACEDADYTFQLVEPLLKELKEKNNFKLFEDVEMPLIPVLYEMEKNGISLDTKFLEKLSEKITNELEKIDTKIYKLAGEEFNINSPAQLKKILFEKLEIPTDGLKKTKTGISTAAGELDKMRDLHPIIDLVSQHRELAKLLSTYVDALPKLVDSNGRIHTSFNQTVASTGRLSSSDPNLQNIPIRTELGREIRKAFVARPGYKLMAVDYSQVELRVVASLSGDKQMVDGFNAGIDIHTQTAASIYDVSLDEVTKDQRYAAKAINFGVIYGLGPYGLAQNVGISYAEAREFIDKYFEVYSGVKKYLDGIKEQTKKDGFVETLFGRRRYLPDINSGVPQIRSAAERAAINAPVQGTAADLLKMAMIKAFSELSTKFPQVYMLLQVHDELVFEVPEDKVGIFAEWIRDLMENIYKLAVPIKVDVEVGDNWGDLDDIV